MKVTLLDTLTGETCVPETEMKPFWWEHGNGSCDCNRQLVFGHDESDEGDTGVCLGAHRYLIIVAEFESGEEHVTLRDLNQDYPEELLQKHLPTMIDNTTPEPTLDELIAAVPEPKQQEAIKLPEAYDTCLIGATVEPYGPDKFVYSLKKLTKFIAKEYDCPAAEARHIITKNFLVPHSGTVCFVNDELILGQVEDDKKIQIVTSGTFGKKK